MTHSIRAYRDRDWTEWLRLSMALFPGEPPPELSRGMQEWRERPDAQVFVIEREGGEGALAGFVEVGSRVYADGCSTSPVGYIEAWYVDADVRREGWGRALLRSAELWAMAQGFTEIASDALLDNAVSQRAHERCGYEEVERVVLYRKALAEGSPSDRS